MEMQRTLKNKNKFEGLILPYFQNYYKVSGCRQYGIGIKINRIKSPEIDQHIHKQLIQLIFNKSAKAIQQNKDNLFNKWCWNNEYPFAKKMNFDPYLHHMQKLTQMAHRPKYKTQNYKTYRRKYRKKPV